jgi:hypothetical protein
MFAVPVDQESGSGKWFSGPGVSCQAGSDAAALILRSIPGRKAMRAPRRALIVQGQLGR